jgi:hypothetical protein
MWMFAAAVLVLLIVAGVISYPLLVHRLEPYARPDLPDETFSERDALLEGLSDLEESHRAGKVSQQDYEAQKQRLQLRYIQVVEGRALDA